MAANKTSLSAGAIIRAVLLDDPDVARITTKIFPIVADKADLPYISYRRAEMETAPQKSGLRPQPADSVNIEVLCYAATYAGSIELAEAVRAALDFKSATTDDGACMRGCYLTGGEEIWENDAYIQQLIFNIKI